MIRPKISVVIATYNRAPLLREALQSLIRQDFTDFEAIIVDDGSTDDTEEIVKSFADVRFRYVHQENRGRSAARNRALHMVRGEYVAFLDSDDLFSEHKLSRHLQCLDAEPEYGMSYTSACVINDDGEEQFSPFAELENAPYYRATESGWLYDSIAYYLPITILLPTVMIRSSLVVKICGFDEQMNRFEDTDFLRRIARQTMILAVDEPLTTIRTHVGNRMEHPERVYESIRYYTEKLKSEVGADNTTWRQGSARLFLHYGLAIYSMDGIKSAAYPFFKAAISLAADNTLHFLRLNKVLGIPQALRLFLSCFTASPFKLSILLAAAIKRSLFPHVSQ